MISVFLAPLVLAYMVLGTPVARQSTREYTLYNLCPTSIDLYIGGAKQGTIPTGGNVVKTLGTDAGFFYTDANGGNSSAVGTIRAGFYEDYYYMVADPNHANTGMRVQPSNISMNGFCETIECDGRGCAQAFSQPPTGFPPGTSTPPVAPYYRCPGANVNYEITFCPTGKFPDQGQPIHFDFYEGECLDVRGAVFANGTPVQIYECNGSQAQRWLITRGSTKVQVAGTNFCLDAGTYPANGVPLKIWQCYDNLPAQQWNYTPDNRIALENQGFCTDLENGIMTDSNPVQTWTCTDNNNNQVWTL